MNMNTLCPNIVICCTILLKCALCLTITTGPGCIRSCIGLLDGDYQSCDRCDVYVSCAGGYRYGNRPCPASLVWDDYNKRCDHSSATCRAVLPDPRESQEVASVEEIDAITNEETVIEKDDKNDPTIEILPEGSGDESELESDGVFNIESGSAGKRLSKGNTITHGDVTVTNDIANNRRHKKEKQSSNENKSLPEIGNLLLKEKLTQNIPKYFNGSCLGTGRYAHPVVCHHYFVCHGGNLVSGKLTIQGIELNHECPYPELFDADKRMCRPYTEVQCGDRIEYKSPCDYSGDMPYTIPPLPARTTTTRSKRSLQTSEIGESTALKSLANNQKMTQASAACYLLNPVCVGLEDGIHGWQGRIRSPWFVTCKDERTIKVEVCPRDNERGMIMLYWSSKGQCAPMWHIPRDEGGFKPECEGLKDGNYADSATRCAYYFRCEQEQVTWYKRCPRGKAYDSKANDCITAAFATCPLA